MASTRKLRGLFSLLLIAALADRAEAQTTSTTAAAQTSTTSPLGLPELMKLALDHNKQVKIDVARIEEARALYQFAASQAFPKGSAQVLFGGPTSEAKTTVINDLSTITPQSLEGDFDFGDLGVSLRFSANAVLPIYTFGKISSAKEAASQLIDASEERVHITEGEVLVNVYKAFWAYQLTSSFNESLREGDEILSKVIEKVEELLEADSAQVTENDRLRLIHAQATLRVRLNESTTAQGIALAALHLLTGVPQDRALPIKTAEIDEVPPEPKPLPELLSEARASRPELRALGHLVDAHQHFLKFRTRSLFPDFFVGAFLETAITTSATDQTNPFLYDRFNFFDAGVGFGFRMELDIFTKLAEVEQAQATLNVRLSEAAAVEEAIDLEVRKIHMEVAGNYSKLGPAEKAFRAARGWLTAAVLAYDIGAGEAGELIDAFLARATAEGDLRRTQFELQIGSADLARAAGQLVGQARSGSNASAAPASEERK